MGTTTVKLKNKWWFVNLQISYEVKEARHPSGAVVGLDRGVVNPAVLSDGTTYASPSAFNRLWDRLAKAQRELARKTQFSRNWIKQLARVNTIHTQISAIRHDQTNKVTTDISKNHAGVILEDLRLRNITASAKGSYSEPVHNVKAKTGFNRTILDRGLGDMGTKLDYKMQWRGGFTKYVNPRHTSQQCPLRDHTEAGKRKTRETFSCLRCGFTAPADLVGSFNIERRGTPFQPAEDNRIGDPKKQELIPMVTLESWRAKIANPVQQIPITFA